MHVHPPHPLRHLATPLNIVVVVGTIESRRSYFHICAYFQLYECARGRTYVRTTVWFGPNVAEASATGRFRELRSRLDGIVRRALSPKLLVLFGTGWTAPRSRRFSREFRADCIGSVTTRDLQYYVVMKLPELLSPAVASRYWFTSQNAVTIVVDVKKTFLNFMLVTFCFFYIF